MRGPLGSGGNRDGRQVPDDFQNYFERFDVSAVATADPWYDLDARCSGERSRDDHRLDDWCRPIWFHAAEPPGLGWPDPGLSVDDDHCGIAGTWLGSSTCEEMECGWSTGALCPSNRGSFFISGIQVNGRARNCPSGHCIPLCLALSRNLCSTLSRPESLSSVYARHSNMARQRYASSCLLAKFWLYYSQNAPRDPACARRGSVAQRAQS
jgi:hypothetical protein